MRLEAVQPDPIEPKPIPQMLTKKKNLLMAAHIINAGADSLRKSLNVSTVKLRFSGPLMDQQWKSAYNRNYSLVPTRLDFLYFLFWQ